MHMGVLFSNNIRLFAAMKYALYARVSTNEQTNENQRIRLVEYCTAKGIEFDYFEETESSRKTRPIKAKLLNKLRKKEYFGVIVCKLDRWARSSSELINELQELVDKGIAFISIQDSIDLTTAAGRMHFHILAAFAEFERSLISERTKEGLNRAKVQGKQLGRPKGSKDANKRVNSGYLARFAEERRLKTGERSEIHVLA
jgi:putative DNA-invertase from lambdoid prophage Rac